MRCFEFRKKIAKHAFTVELPAYTLWFIDNATALFTDGFNAILTIIQNFNVAASQALVMLWDFVASGGAGGIEKLTQDMLMATDTLLVGFEATAQSLPEIMKRKISDEEQSLAALMAELGGSLGMTFSDRFQKNLAAVQIAIPQLDQKALDFQRDAKDDGKGGGNGGLSANEGRLITRGRGEDIAKQQLAEQQRANERLEQIARNTANNGPEIKVVGAKV